MSDSQPASANRAVFLSYAREDGASAQRIAEALRSHGIEVWFDRDELRGGDTWDQKIRRQIGDCALFLPIISAHTQERTKGYFRLEWKLAVEQTHLMAEGVPFLAPVVVDATSESGALVPPEFMRVQWTRLPGALPTPQFVEQINRLLQTSTPAGITAPPMPLRPAPVAPHATPVAPATKSRFPTAIVATLGVAVLALVTFVVLRPATKESPATAAVKPVVAETKPAPVALAPAAPAASPDDKAVAVLPFKNLSEDKEQEYFSDGLTEEILKSVARGGDLRVPGVTSSFSFKGKNATATEIAKALGVSRLVEGSVQRSGTKVRIRVSLTRVADNATEDLGTFTEEFADIFTLYDKVARAVVEKLTHRQLASSVEVNTKNSDAYDYFLRGRALQTRAARYAQEAATLYEQAVAADPTFALAWARLAEARFRAFSGGQDRSPAVVETSREAIDRALGARPDLPEALITRANWSRMVKFDFAAAERDLHRAESLQPPTAELRFAQAQLARDQGNWSEYFRLAQETVNLDPQNGDNLNAIAVMHFIRGHFAEADSLFHRAMIIGGVESAAPFNNQVLLRSQWRGPAAALRLLERAPTGQSGVERARVRTLLELGRKAEARAFILQVGPSLGASSAQGAFTVAIDSTSLDAVGLADAARKRAGDERTRLQKEYDRGNHSRTVLSLPVEEALLGEREAALKRLEAYRRETQFPSVYRRAVDFQMSAVGSYIKLGKFDEALELLQELDANGYRSLIAVGSSLGVGQLKTLLDGDPRLKEFFDRWDAWARAQPDPVDP